MSQKLVSIIVPMYNAERWIRRCVVSLQNQTYTNIEIIVIDDGSTDKSYPICLDLKQNDKKIRVLHQENRGVGAARNLGIDHANGEYILFVDSDDELKLNAIERAGEWLYEGCDIIFWGYSASYSEKYRSYAVEPNCETRMGKTEFNDYFWWLLGRNLIHNIGTKLYKREMLEQYKIRFETDISISEDAIFCVKAIGVSNSYGFVSDSPYIYHLEENGNSLNSGYRKKYLESIVRLHDEIVGALGADERSSKFLLNSIHSVCENELRVSCTNREKIYRVMNVIANNEKFIGTYENNKNIMIDNISRDVMGKKYWRANIKLKNECIKSKVKQLAFYRKLRQAVFDLHRYVKVLQKDD